MINSEYLPSYVPPPGGSGPSPKLPGSPKVAKDYDPDSLPDLPSSDSTLPAGSGTPSEGTINVLSDADLKMQADLYAFMAAFKDLMSATKTFSKISANTELQAQISALTAAAEQINEASVKRLTASYIQSAMQIGGGLFQGAAGVMAARKTIEGASKETSGRELIAGADTNTKKLEANPALPDQIENAAAPNGPKVANPDKLTFEQELSARAETAARKTEGEKLVAEAQTHTAEGQKWHGYGAASGGGLGAMGTTGSAEITHQADQEEQKKQLLETSAKQSEAQQSQDQQLAQAMQELLADVNQLARQQMEAQASVNSAILRV